MPEFLPGLELSRRVYHEVVRERIETELPGVPYAAGLLGAGSDVLGFDTERSTDHDWGPRLTVLLPDEAVDALAPGLHERLRHSLPHTFLGFSVDFGVPNDEGTRWMTDSTEGPVEHKIAITSAERFLDATLGVRQVANWSVIDWLVSSEQALLEVTAGAVFRDEIGAISEARRTLAYYPDQLWRYLLAAQWTRISQQEAFVGRTGEVGDELGSAVIAADLVRDLMRLAFLIERRYAPYAKWLGSAFSGLALAAELAPLLRAACAATNWRERQTALAASYRVLAEQQNRLGIAEPVSSETTLYYDRPFQVIRGERFAEAIRAGISDREILALPPNVGSVDQWVDSTDVLSASGRRQRLRGLYA
jgi:hypothetical protein